MVTPECCCIKQEWEGTLHLSSFALGGFTVHLFYSVTTKSALMPGSATKTTKLSCAFQLLIDPLTLDKTFLMSVLLLCAPQTQGAENFFWY